MRAIDVIPCGIVMLLAVQKIKNCLEVFIFLAAGEIFIEYANEAFPFLLGRKGAFDLKGACLSLI